MIESGDPLIRTRDVARRAQVAQGTLTYHFRTREALLLAAITRLIEEQFSAIAKGLESLAPEDITLDRTLDAIWAAFTTPEGLAVSHLWSATWTDPTLIATVRELEDSLFAATVDAFRPVFGESVRHRDTLTYIDVVISVVRSLVESVPVRGLASSRRRWKLARRTLLTAASITTQS